MQRGYLIDIDLDGNDVVDPRLCERCGCKLRPTTPPGLCGGCTQDIRGEFDVDADKCRYEPGSGRFCGCSLCQDMARSRAGLQ